MREGISAFSVGPTRSGSQEGLEGIPEGGFTDPMIRPNGLQIIKILEKQGGKKKPLEDVRDAIYEILYRQEVDRRYNEWIEGLRKSPTPRSFSEPEKGGVREYRGRHPEREDVENVNTTQAEAAGERQNQRSWALFSGAREKK
jgi:hypothetical protein